MKILMLLSNPFMVDPRVYKEAKTLIEAGHEVTVVVWDRKDEYESESIIEGIRVIRVKNRGLMNLLPNDIFRNPLWWINAYKKGLELYRSGNFTYDVVHCHDLDTLLSGVLLKRKLGVKLVYDAHEIFGYMISWDVPKIVTKFAFILEKTLVSYVDNIITVSEPVIDYFKSITDKPITLVMNCKEMTIQNHQPPNSNVFTLAYIGVLHRRRFFPELVDTIGRIDDVKLLLVAKQENMKLYESVKNKSKAYNNIEFLGTIPYEKVIPMTLKSNAVISIVDDSHPSTKIGIMTKLFDAMACGRPIIVSDNIYSANFVKQHDCGLVVSYDPKSISEAVIKLRDNPSLCKKLGTNGFRAAKRYYNWEIQKERLLNLYSQMNNQ